MICTRRNFLVLTAGAFVTAPAWAESGDHAAARRFMQERHAALTAAMRKSGDPKTNPELLRLLDGMLDYDHFVRQSLGKSWDSLSAAQREQFASVLQGLIRASYRRSLRDITGYDIAYTGESDADDGVLVATVASDPKKKRSEPLRIDYVVAKTSAGQKVRDIVTGGVSLVGNYRKQFARIIKRDGFDALLEKMKKQLDKLDNGTGD
jgi:phospholipid transport system substrate-binding protein